MYKLYTDGSCKGNPGPGGWAYLLVFPNEMRFVGVGNKQATTNNQMELRAIIEGLQVIPDGSWVIVTTDSKYAITVAHSPKPAHKLKNPELVQSLRDLIKKMERVVFVHVNSHAGHSENEYVDRLASMAASCVKSSTP